MFMKFTKAKYQKSLHCGNQCIMDCYTDATYSDIIKYINVLTDKGYTKSELSEPNGNIFATLLDEKSKGLIHISYL